MKINASDNCCKQELKYLVTLLVATTKIIVVNEYNRKAVINREIMHLDKTGVVHYFIISTYMLCFEIEIVMFIEANYCMFKGLAVLNCINTDLCGVFMKRETYVFFSTRDISIFVRGYFAISVQNSVIM